MDKDRTLLEIKTSRTGEETAEAMVQFLASLTGLRRRFFLLWRRGLPISLEIAVFNQAIHFYISCPAKLKTFIEGQLAAQYPKSLILRVKDYIPDVFSNPQTLSLGQMKLASGFLYPIKTYAEFKDVDPMSSLLSVLSKAQPNDKIVIQYLLNPVGSSWQKSGHKAVENKNKDAEGVSHSNPYSKVITQKISFHGFKTAVRIAVNAEDRKSVV